ncbi:hypothetical protein CK203_003000 [Vitis vinifera]|uniref:Uncharacterized protein n=1 Tax=Vitis vinifera TaxID=29760 RepID=A0A438K7S5_VITVI|nr:hypothetical protein CK203_003000 [Vitis vinifera]
MRGSELERAIAWEEILQFPILSEVILTSLPTLSSWVLNSVTTSISQCSVVASSMGTITESAMTVALATVDTKKEAATFEKQRRCQEAAFAASASIAGISIDDTPDPLASNYGDVPLLDF